MFFCTHPFSLHGHTGHHHQPAVLDVVKTQQEGRHLDGREATTRRGASGIKAHGYKLVLFENPKVGHKPPRLVPFQTNCWFGESEVQSRGGQPLSPVVACDREFSRAVDGANQMALQLQLTTRQMTWATVVRVFMLRYAAANAFAACKALGLVKRGTTMWQFQWDIIRRRYFAGPKWCAWTMSPQVVHAPVKVAGKQLCSHYRMTTTSYVCKACNVPLHIKCSGPAHEV